MTKIANLASVASYGTMTRSLSLFMTQKGVIMASKRRPSSAQPTRVAFVGCGGMARHHVAQILRHQDATHVVAVCEPSPPAYEQFCELFRDAHLKPPPNVPDLERLLQTHAGELDAVVYRYAACLSSRSGCCCAWKRVSMCCWKSRWCMNAAEARSLIKVRDRTGRLLVVAFNGSLSPQIRTAVKMLRSGELGRILNISAVVWQGWDVLDAATPGARIRHWRAADFCLIRVRICSIRRPIWPVRSLLRWRPGSTTTTVRWTLPAP